MRGGASLPEGPRITAALAAEQGTHSGFVGWPGAAYAALAVRRGRSKFHVFRWPTHFQTGCGQSMLALSTTSRSTCAT